MKRIITNKWFWIAVAVLVAVGLVLVFWLARELFKPLLWAVLIIGVLWILAEVGLRAWKKRKRKAFDEGLTAKEGIEDRKREWQGFQAELDKQKIDRYELPFYLLVGEPQSGKSVLLQNSDLHFPFGQNKLSGIGGTRGCDWWFTEEAVILDLAGRLFTHEGGVADQVEWEAFLDLLTNFRPICPANGILLVIPCDSLLSDSADVARQKANKIQAALLTLAKKLEAQLPIYLVLTKADKIFGFAECVHRLDAAKRHEMFGWSRGADKIDTPFDLEEARGGFREMVERARLLRSEMQSSARIPEALMEIDRMFAFPDELAALEEPMEIYLRRVFTDSGLSDRLAFRGIYLTSGLQSGVPIARVCAQALGGSGDADMQELEGLFTKQRAYFIKDLVRVRVFGERGVVRPTKGRVLAAQRRALVGYGISAVIALISVIGGFVYLFSDTKADVDALTVKALEMAHGAERAKDWSLVQHLKVLSAIQDAIAQERSTSEEIFNSTRDELKHLYVAEFDLRLVPALRQTMQRHVEDLIAGDGPDSFGDVKLAARCAVLMLGKSDFATSDAAELAEVMPQSERECARGEDEAFTLKNAIDLRHSYSSEPAISPVSPASAASLEAVAKKALLLFDACLVPGKPYQPINETGFMLAWRGLERTYERLSATSVTNDREVLQLAADYGNCWARLESCKVVMSPKTPLTWEIKGPFIIQQLFSLDLVRDPLVKLVAERSGADHPNLDWAAKQELKTFAEVKFATVEKNIDASDVLDPKAFAKKLGKVLVRTLDDDIEVPTPNLRSLIDASLEHECRAGPNADWTLGTLGAELDASVRDLASGEVARNAYVAKVREVGRQFAERYPSWNSIAVESAASGKPLAENEFAGELVAKLVLARTALLTLDRNRTSDFVGRIEKVVEQHLSSLEKNWNALRAGEVKGIAPPIEREVIDSLSMVRGSGSFASGEELANAARRLEERYVLTRQEMMLDFWKSLPPDGEATLEMVRRLDKHFGFMKERFGKPDNDGDDGLDSAWLDDVQAVLVDRLEQHERAARKYWTPPPLHGQAGLTLVDAALTVSRKLGRAEFDEVLRGAAEEVKGPPMDDPLLGRKAPVFEKLERASKALEALRKVRAPSNPRAVTTSPYVEWLKNLADSIAKNPGLAQDGPQLAGKIWDIDQTKQGEKDVPENAGGLYARELFLTLRQRMIDEIRLRYMADLGKLLEEFAVTVDALYAPDFAATKTMDETTVMERLGVLLDKNGRFDSLVKSYRANNNDALGLFPKDPVVLEHEPIWASQQFLGELQVFLLGKDGRRVQDGTVKLSIRPLANEPSSIWDSSQAGKGWKEAFYSPVSAQGDWEYEPVSRDMPEKILVWNFRADRAKRMRMRWNESPSATREFEAADVKLEILGSLAPLLFTWSGEKMDNGSWRVLVTPTGSQLPAPFEVRFLERELPVRPKRPE